MAVTVRQAAMIGAYVVAQKLKGRKKFPLTLMLEPLFRCNLACSGCGKIQHPVEVLRQHLTVQQCFDAVDECGAPVVAIPGGEPLLHPDIAEIVEGLVARKKFVYMCTNAIRLEQNLHKFTPSEYLSFSVHLDGIKHVHDKAVARDGIFDIAVSAIKAAKARGFRVTTNTTIFNDAKSEEVQEFFDFATSLGVDGMMISPGYPLRKGAGPVSISCTQSQTKALFREIFAPYVRRSKKSWNFNASPALPRFLDGRQRLRLHAVGHAVVQPLRLAKPCYSSARATTTPTKSCSRRPSGATTARRAATRNASTAWFTAASSRRRPTTR